MPFYGRRAAGLRARAGDRARVRRGQRRPRARRVAARAGNVVRRRAAAARGRAGARVRRILVLDDEPQILRALRVVLREAGFEAIPAETAEEALDRRRSGRPTPRSSTSCSPTATASRSRASCGEWSEMPIIVLSAVGDEDEKVRALEAGADDYVTKPFGPRELVARLQAALRRAGATPDEPMIARRRARGRPRRARRARRRRGGAPDADRVRPAAHARPPPRAPAHAPRAARRGVGPRVRERHGGAAHAHRQPAPQDRVATTSAPTRASATASQNLDADRAHLNGRLTGPRLASRSCTLDFASSGLARRTSRRWSSRRRVRVLFLL